MCKGMWIWRMCMPLSCAWLLAWLRWCWRVENPVAVCQARGMAILSCKCTKMVERQWLLDVEDVHTCAWSLYVDQWACLYFVGDCLVQINRLEAKISWPGRMFSVAIFFGVTIFLLHELISCGHSVTSPCKWNEENSFNYGGRQNGNGRRGKQQLLYENINISCYYLTTMNTSTVITWFLTHSLFWGSTGQILNTKDTKNQGR